MSVERVTAWLIRQSWGEFTLFLFIGACSLFFLVLAVVLLVREGPLALLLLILAGGEFAVIGLVIVWQWWNLRRQDQR